MPNGSTDTKRAALGLLRGHPEPAIQPIKQRLNDTFNYTLNLNSSWALRWSWTTAKSSIQPIRRATMPSPRHRTKPKRGSVRRRLAAKKLRSELKSQSRRPDQDYPQMTLDGPLLTRRGGPFEARQGKFERRKSPLSAANVMATDLRAQPRSGDRENQARIVGVLADQFHRAGLIQRRQVRQRIDAHIGDI